MATITPAPSVSFQAKWNQENFTLKQSDHLPARVWRVVKEILTKVFCCCVKPLAYWLILPASKYNKRIREHSHALWTLEWFGSINDENALLRKNFQAIPLHLKTPEGNVISGAFYQNKAAKGQDIPTIIYSGGNGEIFKRGGAEWLLKAQENTSQPFNVVVYDYPSCGGSKGKATERTLVMASDTVYQCVNKEFNISEPNIHSIGKSLGGGVSAQLMAIHPKSGRVVNSHSFKSLNAMINDTSLISSIISNLLCCCKCCLIPSCIKKIGTSLLSLFHWKLDSEKALSEIKDRTQIVYHPKDELMEKASLVYAALEKRHLAPCEMVTLKAIDPSVEANENHHIAGMHLYQDENGVPATERIINFVLGGNVFSTIKEKAG